MESLGLCYKPTLWYEICADRSAAIIEVRLFDNWSSVELARASLGKILGGKGVVRGYTRFQLSMRQASIITVQYTLTASLDRCLGTVTKPVADCHCPRCPQRQRQRQR